MDHQRLRGATETNSINTLVQSGRTRSAAKRLRMNPSRMGLPMFQHRKVNDFEKRAFADSDISIFQDEQGQPPFFGFVAINEDATRDDAFITVAVSGRVNVLNTSIWPIYAFDRVCVVLQARGTKYAWSNEFFNLELDYVGDCALVCSLDNYNKNILPTNKTPPHKYFMTEVGFALTGERCEGGRDSRSSSHLFSLHMDVFKPLP